MAATAKENILKKIRQALTEKTPEPFSEIPVTQPVFHPGEGEMDVLFAENFTKLQGNFSFCLSILEMTEQLIILAINKKWNKWYCNDQRLKLALTAHGWPYKWHHEVASCHASITGCETLVARTGTIVLSSAASGGRTPSVYAPVHVCVAYHKQLVYNIDNALDRLQTKYGNNLPSLVSFASGPSRTADIEKTLVTGVHGPKEVYCFLIEE